ncbi:MAG TPA: MlaD family protein [Gammaproteobacteria bacterium]|nr:MlaD family protein [Gammaproteobacteria bacterium]
MKRDNLNYLAVGLFVLSMFVVLLIVLYRLTGRSVDTDSYYAMFSNVTGIRQGSPVTYGGFRIGRVEDIKPQRRNGATYYRMEVRVRHGWPIPKDSVIHIVQPGILTENQVDIIEGASQTMLKPGQTIPSDEAVTMIALLNSMSKELRPLLANLNKTLGSVSGDLNDKLPHITEGVTKLLDRLNENAQRLSQLTGGKNQQRLNDIIKNTDKLTRNLARTSQGFDASRKQLDALLRKSNRLVDENGQDIRRSVVELRNTLGVLSQRIDSIVYNMDSASRNMNEFTRQLRDNPGALLHSKPPADNAEGRP